MPWILPSGNYYDATDHVATGSIAVAQRPSKDHVLTPNWEQDPLNAATAWRDKTPAELNAEDDTRFDERLDRDSMLKALFEELDILSPGFRARTQAKARRP